MAHVNLRYNFSSSDDVSNSDETIISILAPSDQRIRLKRLTIYPYGNAGATKLQRWQIEEQSDQGTGLTDDTAGIVKLDPAPSTIRSTVKRNPSAPIATQPTTVKVLKELASHQQTPVTYVPDEPLYIEGGKSLGIVFMDGPSGPITNRYEVEWEE